MCVCVCVCVWILCRWKDHAETEAPELWYRYWLDPWLEWHTRLTLDVTAGHGIAEYTISSQTEDGLYVNILGFIITKRLDSYFSHGR